MTLSTKDFFDLLFLMNMIVSCNFWLELLLILLMIMVRRFCCWNSSSVEKMININANRCSRRCSVKEVVGMCQN